MDLPSEASGDEQDLRGNDTDDELEDYYEELGIAGEQDVNASYKKTKKVVKKPKLEESKEK